MEGWLGRLNNVGLSKQQFAKLCASKVTNEVT